MADWKGRIVATPGTLFGKPRVNGTRIGVEFVVDLMSSGWSQSEILEEYPHVTREDLQAVFAFMRDCIKEGSLRRESHTQKY